MHPKKDIIALVVVVLTTRPPGGFIVFQARAASPMVCGWRLCAWLGCRRATGDGRVQSRRPPWCAGNEFRVLTQALKNSLPQHVEVRYSSTYAEEKKGMGQDPGNTRTTLAVKNMLAPKTNVFVITNVFAFMSCLS